MVRSEVVCHVCDALLLRCLSRQWGEGRGWWVQISTLKLQHFLSVRVSQNVVLVKISEFYNAPMRKYQDSNFAAEFTLQMAYINEKLFWVLSEELAYFSQSLI
jgi:hypothetical protein